MIVQFDARHIWGCRVSPSTRGIFAGGVGRRVPIARPMRACVPGVSMPVLSPQLRRSSTLF